MPSQSQGTQQLLQAEKRAKDKLEDAKKSRCPSHLPWEGQSGRGRCGRERGPGAGHPLPGGLGRPMEPACPTASLLQREQSSLAGRLERPCAT